MAARIRIVFIAVALLLCADNVCNADNMIERMLRQVLPATMTNEVDQQQQQQPLLHEEHHQHQQQQQQIVTEDDNSNTAGWNPFTWFTPRIRTIPYNPDTDLTTVCIFEKKKLGRFFFCYLL